MFNDPLRQKNVSLLSKIPFLNNIREGPDLTKLLDGLSPTLQMGIPCVSRIRASLTWYGGLILGLS